MNRDQVLVPEDIAVSSGISPARLHSVPYFVSRNEGTRYHRKDFVLEFPTHRARRFRSIRMEAS